MSPFVYRFDSEDTPPIRLRLKVEINSREHFSVHGFTSVPFAVSSRWFEGSCQITSYELDELLGTKLRALYQRRKGRDLFDLATALKNPAVDPARIIAAFSEYMDQGGHHITHELFERNLASKLHDPLFTADIGPLLAPGYNRYVAFQMAEVAIARHTSNPKREVKLITEAGEATAEKGKGSGSVGVVGSRTCPRHRNSLGHVPSRCLARQNIEH